MSVTTRISWGNDPGVESVKVEYKKSVDGTYTQPVTGNPTTATHYDLELENSTSYDVRLTSQGENCTADPVIKTFTTKASSVEIKWDYFSSDPGDATTAILAKTVNTTHNADYVIPTSQVAAPSWVIVREPATETAKTRWQNTTFNYGTIPDQVWLDAVVSGGYRYYKTRDLKAFDVTANTTFYKV